MTITGERAGNVLVYSSAYLSIVAMVEVAIAIVMLSLPPNPAPVVLGLVTFAVYVNDRIEDMNRDAISNPRRVAFIRRHKSSLTLLAAIAYGLAISLAVLGGPVALGITILPGVFWVIYATDWIPNLGIHVQRVKDILILNTTVVALAWAISLTFLPLAYAQTTFTWTAVVVFAYFFSRSFVDTEIPNIRDVEGDRALGVDTLPVAFGMERTKQALYGVDLITAGLILTAALVGVFTKLVTVPLLLGVAYSMCVTTLVGRNEDIDLLAIATELEYFVVAVTFVIVWYAL